MYRVYSFRLLPITTGYRIVLFICFPYRRNAVQSTETAVNVQLLFISSAGSSRPKASHESCESFSLSSSNALGPCLCLLLRTWSVYTLSLNRVPKAVSVIKSTTLEPVCNNVEQMLRCRPTCFNRSGDPPTPTISYATHRPQHLLQLLRRLP